MRTMLALLPLIRSWSSSHTRARRRRGPWIATLSITRKALAVGECSAVSIDLKSAKSEWPRGPNGQLVSMSDFDLSVSAPSARAAVGKYDGASSFAVCACPKAPAGTVATVTATYPSKWIAPKGARARGGLHDNDVGADRCGREQRQCAWMRCVGVEHEWRVARDGAANGERIGDRRMLGSVPHDS